MVKRTIARAVAFSLAVGFPGVVRAEPPAVVETAPTQPAGSKMRLVGWATVGGGAAVLGASGVMYAIALKERDDLIDRRSPSADQAAERDLRIAKVLTVVGLLAVGTGVTLVLVAPENDQQVRVSAGLDQITVGGTF